MKIHGVKLEQPKDKILVIPRDDSQIIIKAKAVLDYAEFDLLVKEPKPPTVRRRDGEISPLLNDPKYQKAISDYATLRSQWMILQSLSATPGLEWESVDLQNPETWGNYEKELRESGFSLGEYGRILELVTEACGLNQSRIDEATRAFLATQEGRLEPVSSPQDEQKSMPSGEPVSK